MSALIVKNEGGTVIVTSDAIKKKSWSLAERLKQDSKLEDPLPVLLWRSQ